MIADSCNSAFTQKRAAQFTEAFRSGSAVFRRTMALPESGISGVSAHTSLEILFKQTLARLAKVIIDFINVINHQHTCADSEVVGGLMLPGLPRLIGSLIYHLLDGF